MSDFESTPAEMIEISLSTGDINQEYFNHVKKINDIFYDQVKSSDQKAAYIFTFMLAFLISSSEGRSVFSWARYAEENVLSIIFSGLMAISSIIVILSAIIVVLPRQVGITTTMFWGTWPKHRLLFEQAAARADAKYLFHQYLENADALSMIARKKYRFVGIAFRGLIVTVVSYVLLLLAH